MTDLVNDSTAQSPKRKFSFRFPHLVHHSSGGDKDSTSMGNGQHPKCKTRNFSEEVKNVPDLQVNAAIINLVRSMHIFYVEILRKYFFPIIFLCRVKCLHHFFISCIVDVVLLFPFY